MTQRIRARALLLSTLLIGAPLGAQVPDLAMTERIKEEGMMRSRALALFHTLTDVYGGRLSGSPEHTAAAAW